MKVLEIFNSIDGEVNAFGQGRISTFIRLSGCNLACPYCDTPDSISGSKGTEMSVEEIMAVLGNRKNVTITGGEPLMWFGNGLEELLDTLMNNECRVNIETNGTILPPEKYLSTMYMGEIGYTVDYKWETERQIFTPSFMRFNGILKIPVSNEIELHGAYLLAKVFHDECNIAFSPIVSEGMSVNRVLEFMLQNNIHWVLLNIQIHKLLDFK
jgi:7-carboxy-7-deazaguanine synthase